MSNHALILLELEMQLLSGKITEMFLKELSGVTYAEPMKNGILLMIKGGILCLMLLKAGIRDTES